MCIIKFDKNAVLLHQKETQLCSEFCKNKELIIQNNRCAHLKMQYRGCDARRRYQRVEH